MQEESCHFIIQEFNTKFAQVMRQLDYVCAKLDTLEHKLNTIEESIKSSYSKLVDYS
jgi:uncharacterized coiled-coil protein SlyX